MTDQLRPHQMVGSQFLAERQFALLADQAGAGKTATSVRACDIAGAQRVLVICPATVRPHWAREFTRWQMLDRPVTVIDGSPTGLLGPGVNIVSHATLVKADVQPLLRHTVLDVLIVDEGGEFRSFDAARTRHLYAPVPYGLWSHARQTWHLTATPVTNSAADLYPLWHGPLAGRTPLGSPTWFEFCTKFTNLRRNGLNDLKPVGVHNAPALRELLRPITLRRDIDVGVPLQIEELAIDVPESELIAVQAELRGWTPARVAAELMDDSANRSEAEFSRARRALGVAMAPRVADWLIGGPLSGGHGPLVVFFYHQDVKNILHRRLIAANYRVSWIDGGVTRRQLETAERTFQAGGLDVLLVQIQAGSMGLTFTRSDMVVMAELPWTAAMLWQAIKRVHRIGQTRACLGVLMKCRFWLADVMLSVLARKKTMSAELLDPLTETL